LCTPGRTGKQVVGQFENSSTTQFDPEGIVYTDSVETFVFVLNTTFPDIALRLSAILDWHSNIEKSHTAAPESRGTEIIIMPVKESRKEPLFCHFQTFPSTIRT
jgi:hypothetical protein